MESGSVIRATGIATILLMDTAITRTVTTDHIDTMVMGVVRTITGTAITVTTDIITTIATNLAKDKDRLSWLGHRFEPALFAKKSKRQPMI